MSHTVGISLQEMNSDKASLHVGLDKTISYHHKTRRENISTSHRLVVSSAYAKVNRKSYIKIQTVCPLQYDNLRLRIAETNNVQNYCPLTNVTTLLQVRSNNLFTQQTYFMIF